MKTIITPTDFSAVSLNAVNYAADMARTVNANLLILHATDNSLLFDEEDCEGKLTDLRKNLIKRTGNKIKINSKQVLGSIENELIKICDYKNPFAVVMATHGASLRKHLFIESVTVYLSRNLQYPVMIIPENVNFKPVRRIVVATDLKNINALPVGKILAVVSSFNAKLHMLHINEPGENFNHASPEVEKLGNYFKNLNPVFHFLKNKNVQKGILFFAENNNVDMILTFPKKHAFFHNSESKQLIYNSPVTVMTIQ